MEDSLSATKEIQTPGSDRPTKLGETGASITLETLIIFTLKEPGNADTIELQTTDDGELPKDIRFTLTTKTTTEANGVVSQKVRTNVPNNTIRFILQG
jgi:hypothetical protein